MGCQAKDPGYRSGALLSSGKRTEEETLSLSDGQDMQIPQTTGHDKGPKTTSPHKST